MAMKQTLYIYIGPCLAVWHRVLTCLWSYIGQDVACIPNLPQLNTWQKGIFVFQYTAYLTLGSVSKDMAPAVCCGWDLLCGCATDPGQNYCSIHHNPRACA